MMTPAAHEKPRTFWNGIRFIDLVTIALILVTAGAGYVAFKVQTAAALEADRKEIAETRALLGELAGTTQNLANEVKAHHEWDAAATAEIRADIRNLQATVGMIQKRVYR